MTVDNGASGFKKVEVNYPSNARSRREEKDEPRKVEKVIKGAVVQRKKSLGKRFLETFIGDDMDSISGYIIHDVLIPAVKDTLYDMVKGSFEMALFGEKKGSRTKRDQGKSFVSYNNYSSTGNNRDDRRHAQDNISRNRARHNFDDLVLTTRGEAEEVLSCLVDLTIDYGQASVADLYDLVGLTGEFTDHKYGWTDLRSASVSRARDGYLLNLPKTRALE